MRHPFAISSLHKDLFLMFACNILQMEAKLSQGIYPLNRVVVALSLRVDDTPPKVNLLLSQYKM